MDEFMFWPLDGDFLFGFLVIAAALGALWALVDLVRAFRKPRVLIVRGPALWQVRRRIILSKPCRTTRDRHGRATLLASGPSFSRRK